MVRNLKLPEVPAWASDGAPLAGMPRGALYVWGQPDLVLPPEWLQTERPQLTPSGYKSAANAPNG